MLSEVKSDRERQISYVTAYMQTLKKVVQMNLFTKQKQSHRCRKQIYGYWGEKEGGINWEIGIDIYTLLYTKQITNKDLLYGTGNSTQYSVMIYMRKESEKKWIYVYV